MDIYLSSLYLAPVQYYTNLISKNRIFIERNDNYTKQTYRNRCVIMEAGGSMSLTIPVIHSSSTKIAMKDIRISDHGNWQHVHWNAIVSAYNSTPFFEYYQDYFYPFYHNKYSFLFDFNEELRILLLDLLNIEGSDIQYTDSYKAGFTSHELDLRTSIHPKVDWRVAESSFQPMLYYQVFGEKNGFAPNLSIIDLLFNMGNESILILNDSLSHGCK